MWPGDGLVAAGDVVNAHNLLCEVCEQKFGRHGNYAALVLHRGRGSQKPPSLRCSRAGRLLRCKGIEYAPAKLFQMSLLWRLGLTTLETLKGISLGDRHEARLRAKLLADDPGGIDGHPCHMAAIYSLWQIQVGPHRSSRFGPRPCASSLEVCSGRGLLFLSPIQPPSDERFPFVVLPHESLYRAQLTPVGRAYPKKS